MFISSSHDDLLQYKHVVHFPDIIIDIMWHVSTRYDQTIGIYYICVKKLVKAIYEHILHNVFSHPNASVSVTVEYNIIIHFLSVYPFTNMD